MNPSAPAAFRMTEPYWRVIILALSAAVILFTLWCLSNGITTIFMHLYYFPIVLLAYRYRWKGCGLATLLALVYLGLVMVFDPGQTDVILGAFYRVLVFVGIAAVIAYLSDRLAIERRSARESAEIKESYLSLAPAIILGLDRDGSVTFLNPRGCEILECTPEEAVGKSWADNFLPVPERERVKQVFSRLLAGDVGPNRVVENPVLTRSGQERMIRWHNTVLYDESRAIGGILGFGEDITEEKKAQDSLRAMQQFQESVITNANVWISVIAPDGSTLLLWNDAAEAISGYKKSDVVGTKTVWKQLYPDPAYRKKVTGEIRRIITRDTFLENFETEIRCADGTKKTIVWNTRGMRDAGGNVSGYIAIGRDISAQMAAEFRAAESSRFLGAMINTLPIPVFFKDLSGKYLGSNPPFEKYLGITHENLVGKTVYDLSPKDLADKYAAADQQLFDNPVPQRYETQVQYADGSSHDVIFYKSPFFNSDGTLGGLIGAFLDITDRKRSEEVLRESEEKFRILFTNMAAGSALHEIVYDHLKKTVDYRIIDVNPAFGRILGMKREDIIGRTSREVYRVDTPPFLDTYARVASSGKPEEFEVYFAPLEKHFSISAYSPGAGRFATIFEDITERKRTEEEIRLSNVILKTQQETSPDGILIVDESGKIISFNNRFTELWGIPPAIIAPRVDEPVLSFVVGRVASPEEFLAKVNYLYEHREEKSREEIRLTDGKVFERYSTPMLGEDNRYFGRVWYFHDITERKNQEKTLRESEEKYRAFFTTSRDCIFITTVDGSWVDFNDAAVGLFGYENREDLLKIKIPRVYANPDERDAHIRYIREHGHSFEYPVDLRKKDGTIINALVTTVARKDASGNVIGFQGSIRDITARKQAEAALRSSESRLHTLVQTIPDLIWLKDKEGVYLSCNTMFERFFGAMESDIAGKTDYDFVSRELADSFRENDRRAMAAGKPTRNEEWITFADDGHRALLETTKTPVIDDKGTLLGVLGIGRDITDRKRAEDEIKRSIERFRMVMDSIDALVYVSDMQTYELLFINKYGKDIWGEDVEGKSCWQIIQSGQPGPCPFCTNNRLVDDKGNPTGIYNWEFQNTVNGHWYDCRDSAIRWIDGRIVRLEIATDITGRKQVEEALNESRQLFSDIISFLPDPTFVIDRDGGVLAWNRALEQLSGVPAGNIIGKGDYEYSLWMYGKRRPVLIDLVLHPDQDSGRLDYTDIHVEGRTVTAQTETIRPSHKKKFSLSLVASPLIDAQGKITGAIESMRDISHIKETESELARINQNLEKIVSDRTRALEEEVLQRIHAEKNVQDALSYTRSVIEANPDLMVVLDRSGIVLDVNATAESLTGVPREQLIGTQYFSYLIDDGSHRDMFLRLLESGKLENTIEVRRIDGHITPMSVNATVVAGSAGTDLRIIVAAHDITRQKEDEEAIRASLDEKVILLREVHHRVKNNLQIIISLVNLQMRQTSDPVVKQIMAETQNRVRAMSLVHEKLYRSESLSRIDFADYTRFLATQLFSFYGTDTRRVKLDMAMGKIMVDINTAVPLGLLLNELISNALKHAFPEGKEGTIGVSGVEDGDLITLVVRDDGIGIPEDLDWKNTTSLGMRLVTSLIDQVDGTITLDRENGTVFAITVKRPPSVGGER